MTRFYNVQSGKIRCGRYDIREYDIDVSRKNIGIVSQESFLFNTSIKENLLYANPNATFEQIEKAAKIAQIHDFICNQQEGYDTIVGEKGIKLSGGEKQRLSIARIILKNPKIIIMDEPTSALDIITEKKLWTSINKHFNNHIKIIITHRIPMLKNFDKIIVLAKGKVIECGTYDELINARGYFSQLINQHDKNILNISAALYNKS